jgi:hypothetical protein
MGVGVTPNRCTYIRFQKHGGTLSKPFSTPPEPSSTHKVIPSKTEHSATLPRAGRSG